MIKILISTELRDDIAKTFKSKYVEVITLLCTLKENPNKGKTLGNVGKIVIKELKYKSFRFYFVVDGHELFLFNKDETKELLIKFLKMSKKHNQQKIIDEIKEVLREIGFDDVW